MAMGSSTGIRGDINITPLVDVVLVLLIIFMVTTPVLQMGLDVEVPPKVEVTEPPPEPLATQLVIDVRPDGFWLNQEKVGALTDRELTTPARPPRPVDGLARNRGAGRLHQRVRRRRLRAGGASDGHRARRGRPEDRVPHRTGRRTVGPRGARPFCGLARSVIWG